MIAKVLVAQRQTIDALRQHLWQWMLHPPGCATVGETLRYALQQIDLPVRLAQQQRPAVGRNLTTREPSLHPA